MDHLIVQKLYCPKWRRVINAHSCRLLADATITEGQRFHIAASELVDYQSVILSYSASTMQ